LSSEFDFEQRPVLIKTPREDDQLVFSFILVCDQFDAQFLL